MRIQFTLSADDLRAYLRSHYERNPVKLENSRLFRVLIFVVGIAGLLHSVLLKRTSFFIYLGWILILAFGFFYRKLVGVLSKQPIFWLSLKKNTFEPVEYEITENGMTIREKNLESRVQWGGIREVISLDGHTFVYVGSEIAHIFPRDKIGNEEYDEFVGKLMSGWNSRRKV